MRTTSIKFIILGEVNTGKSTLFHCFATDKAFLNATPTIGFDFINKTIIDQRYGQIEFKLWDTSGTERFNTASIMQTYYRGAEGVILCFDISDRSTFDAISSKWFPRLRSSMIGARYKCILVGNKSDLGREVTEEEGQQFALHNHLHYVELSSLYSPTNLVRQPFLLLAKQLMDEGICTPVYKTIDKKKENRVREKVMVTAEEDEKDITCCLS